MSAFYEVYVNTSFLIINQTYSEARK